MTSIYSTICKSPQETARLIALLAIGAIGLIAFNPYWYGDAVWYARSLTERGVLPLDPGHFLWKPTASFFWNIHSFLFIPLDPLLVLQILSALATVYSAVLITQIAKQLGLSSPVGVGVAFGLSHFALVYGGSGSSYSVCVMCLLLAVRAYLSMVESDALKAVILAGIFGALSLSFWGLGILELPLLAFLPLLFSPEPSRKIRILHGLFIALITCGIFGFILLTGYILSEHSISPAGFLAWLQSSGHGIPAEFSLLNLLRAPLGLMQSVLYLGTIGTAIKGLLTGTSITIPIIPAVMLCTFSIGSLALFVCSVRSALRSVIFYLLLLILIPSLCFAAFWQGSDVERFCLVLPFLLLFLAELLEKKLATSVRILPLILFGGFNLAFLVFNTQETKVSLIRELIDVSSDYLPQKSLIIVTGQDFNPHTWAAAGYHSNHTYFSLLYDAQTEGLVGWEKRLRKAVFKTVDHGGKIAVLDSLISRKPSSPQPILTGADPHPQQEEIFRLFEDWNAHRMWPVQDYLFVEITLPEVSSEHDSK